MLYYKIFHNIRNELILKILLLPNLKKRITIIKPSCIINKILTHTSIHYLLLNIPHKKRVTVSVIDIIFMKDTLSLPPIILII